MDLEISDEVMKVVHEKIPPDLIQSMLNYLDEVEHRRLIGPGDDNFKLYVFLYYLVHGKGQSVVSSETGFPHSEMRDLFGTLRRLLVDWSLSYTRPSTLKKRKEISESKIKEYDLRHITLIGDTEDFLIEKQDDEKSESKFYCKKMKHFAIRVQFLMRLDGKVEWISPWNCPTEHESECILKCEEEIRETFCVGDTICLDFHHDKLKDAWKGKKHHPSLVSKNRGPSLSDSETAYNLNLHQYKKEIRNELNNIKGKFGWFEKPWQKNADSLWDIVKIATGINNYIIMKNDK